MPHDPEQKRLAGQKGRSHGIYAIKARGEAAMTPDQRQTLRDIQESLETPEGVQQALLERVAMSTMIMSVLEDYIKSQVDEGMPLDAITILRSWPAFQNSTVRSLMHLKSMLPKPQHDALADEVEKIKALVRDAEKAQETVVQAAPEPVESPQRATGSDGEGQSD